MSGAEWGWHTPTPPTKSLGFRGFDSSRLLILRGGILMSVESIGGLPESSTRGLLVAQLLVFGLGVCIRLWYVI